MTLKVIIIIVNDAIGEWPHRLLMSSSTT